MKWLCVVMAWFFLVGCDDGSERRLSLIDGPRILAVKAEPPVIGPGESAVLSALVVAADGSIDDLPLSWRACAPWTPILDPNTDCGPDASTALDGGVITAPEGVAEPLEVPIIVEGAVDGAPLIAVKRVRIMPEVPAVRGNPDLGELRVADADGQAVVTGREYEVMLDLSLASAEPAAGSDDDAVARIYLYGTNGEFDEPARDVEVGDDGELLVDSSNWRAPDEPGPSTLWVVVVDDSGGTSWRELSLDAVAEP